MHNKDNDEAVNLVTHSSPLDKTSNEDAGSRAFDAFNYVEPQPITIKKIVGCQVSFTFIEVF